MVAAFLLFVTLLFPFHAPTPKSTTQLIDQIRLSLVRVTFGAIDKDGAEQTHVCAGWVTSATMGQAITARHCVDPEARVFVDDIDSYIIRFDSEFALVAVPRMAKPPMDLAPGLPNVGDATVSVGYGYGIFMGLPRSVAALGTEESEGDVIISGPLVPGMSGGPTVDQFGRVVGMNQKANEVIGILCGVEEIRVFLRGK